MQHVKVPDGHNVVVDIFQAMEDTKVSAMQDMITDISAQYGIVRGLMLSSSDIGLTYYIADGIAYTENGNRIELKGDSTGQTTITVLLSDIAVGHLIILELVDKEKTTLFSVHPITGSTEYYVMDKINNYKVIYKAASDYAIYKSGNQSHIVVGAISAIYNNILSFSSPTPLEVVRFAVSINEQAIENININDDANIEESKILFDADLGHNHTGGVRGKRLHYDDILDVPPNISLVLSGMHDNGIVSSNRDKSTNSSLKCVLIEPSIMVNNLVLGDVAYIQGHRIDTVIGTTISNTGLQQGDFIVCKLSTGVNYQGYIAVVQLLSEEDLLIGTVHINDNIVTVSDDRIFGIIEKEKLQDFNVQTIDIVDNAVTKDKLAVDSVDTTKILNGAVTKDKLSTNIVNGVYPLHAAGIVGRYGITNSLKCEVNATGVDYIGVSFIENSEYWVIGGGCIVNSTNISFDNKHGAIDYTVSFVNLSAGDYIVYIGVDGKVKREMFAEASFDRYNKAALCKVHWDAQGVLSDLVDLRFSYSGVMDLKYITSFIASTVVPQMIIVTGEVTHNNTVPIPDGYIREQCHVTVSMRSVSVFCNDSFSSRLFFKCNFDATTFIVSAYSYYVRDGYSAEVLCCNGIANYMLIGVK